MVTIDTETKPVSLTPQQKCEAKGGFWDEATKTCKLPAAQPSQGTAIEKPAQTPREQLIKEQEQQRVSEAERRKREASLKAEAEASLDKPIFGGKIDLTEQPKTTETDTEAKSDTIINFRDDGTIDYTRGGQTLNLTKEEYDVVQGKAGMVTDKVKQARALQSQAQLLGQQQAGQVGQFEQLGVQPTGLDIKEGLVTSLISQLPKALTYGLGAAAVTGAGTNPLSIIAGVGTFLGTLTSGLISNFKSQRSDTTTAQQRVLDEGKQTLSDWATMAAADPTRRSQAIAGFNAQLALIDQAYRQMKLDTNADVAKFETALPNLAEFESFYNLQGERDFLMEDMRLSLGGGLSPEAIDMRLMSMKNRIKK